MRFIRSPSGGWYNRGNWSSSSNAPVSFQLMFMLENITYTVRASCERRYWSRWHTPCFYIQHQSFCHFVNSFEFYIPAFIFLFSRHHRRPINHYRKVITCELSHDTCENKSFIIIIIIFLYLYSECVDFPWFLFTWFLHIICFSCDFTHFMCDFYMIHSFFSCDFTWFIWFYMIHVILHDSCDFVHNYFIFQMLFLHNSFTDVVFTCDPSFHITTHDSVVFMWFLF